jgi:hypothetical protein
MRYAPSSFIQTELSVMDSHHISPVFAGVADFTAGQESSSIRKSNLAPKNLKTTSIKRTYRLRHAIYMINFSVA